MGRREKRTRDTERPSGTNQMLTVSLFIILLAFFILLNTYAVVDQTKKMKALGSLLGSFGILPGGLSVFTGEGKETMPPTAPINMRQFDVDTIMSLPVPEDIDTVAIESDDQKNVVTIQEELLFDKGGLKIKRSAFPVLDALCRIIKRDNSNVEIAGHTAMLEQDEDAGWKLSGFQAMAVARYFIERGNVDPKTVAAYGCSEYRPRIMNVTRETRRQNRRVDIVISPGAWRHVNRFYKNRPDRFFTFKKFVFDIFD